MKKPVLWILVLAFFAIFANGISAKSRPLSYKKALKRATRGQELYEREDFHASIKWQATRLDDAFLDAWAREHAKIYELSAAHEAEFRAELAREYGGFEAYFVEFYTYDFRESDLTKPKSVWKLRLKNAETSEEGQSPIKIVKVGKPDSYLKRIFPYINPWSGHSYVFFQKPTTTTADTSLHVLGPNGDGHLVWANHKP